MKKKVNLLVCILSSVLFCIVGFIIGINLRDEIKLSKIEKQIVGTFKTSTWNGKDAVLVINEDKTCIYPSGSSKCEWVLQNNNIVLYTPGEEYIPSYLYLNLNEGLTEEYELMMVEGIKNSIWGASSADYDSTKHQIKIMIDESFIDEIYEEVIKLKDVKSVEKEIGGYKDIIDEDYVTIVDKGLLLHGHFFEKLD